MPSVICLEENSRGKGRCEGPEPALRLVGIREQRRGQCDCSRMGGGRTSSLKCIWRPHFPHFTLILFYFFEFSEGKPPHEKILVQKLSMKFVFCFEIILNVIGWTGAWGDNEIKNYL